MKKSFSIGAQGQRHKGTEKERGKLKAPMCIPDKSGSSTLIFDRRGGLGYFGEGWILPGS